MDLTVAQALEHGIAAHRAGKLRDAEHFYRAILQSQPTHADANHNLGVLAVSINKARAGLQFFKRAIETSPKVEQFWLSYINALIKEEKVEIAKQALEQAKKQDMAREKLNVLELQLSSINKQKDIDRLTPPQSQTSNLLEHYQDGQYEEAERLALSLIHI